MRKFPKEHTLIIFLDIEFYVPVEDRKPFPYSLSANPTKSTHLLLGGVFYRVFPLLNKMDKRNFWIWRERGYNKEGKLIRKIYKFFKESWYILGQREDKKAWNPDLIVIGTNINSLDIPSLFIKARKFNIDTEEELYNTFFKIKVVDLSNVGIPYFTRKPDPVLYPITTRGLLKRFKINLEKTSGKNVWDMFENEEYEAIEKRTEEEVIANIKIYEKIQKILKKDIK